MKYTPAGVDIAKHVIQVHFINEEVVDKQVRHQDFLAYFSNRAPYLICMEAWNDVMDARAIWMAVQQPGKEIAIKTEEQQSVLVLHRPRRQLVKFRTAQINALHSTP